MTDGSMWWLIAACIDLVTGRNIYDSPMVRYTNHLLDDLIDWWQKRFHHCSYQREAPMTDRSAKSRNAELAPTSLQCYAILCRYIDRMID